jgi:hypothetical protein
MNVDYKKVVTEPTYTKSLQCIGSIVSGSATTVKITVGIDKHFLNSIAQNDLLEV